MHRQYIACCNTTVCRMRVTVGWLVVAWHAAHAARACGSRAIDTYIADSIARTHPNNLLITADHTIDLVNPDQYPLNTTVINTLDSTEHIMTDDEANHVLANPFWLACLQLVLDLHLPRPTAAHDVTLVTHTTASRLHSIAAQCAAWPGSLVVAVYLPLHGQPNASLQLTHLATRAATIHARGACTLRMLAYAESLPPGADAPPLQHVYEYPINALRNRALLAATTELVMLVDADMVPGPRWWLEEILTQPNNSYVEHVATRCRSQRAAAVLLPFALHDDGQLLQVGEYCTRGGHKLCTGGTGEQGPPAAAGRSG